MVIIRKPVQRSENIVDRRAVAASRSQKLVGARPLRSPKVDEAMLREMMSQVNKQLGRIRRSRMR